MMLSFGKSESLPTTMSAVLAFKFQWAMRSTLWCNQHAPGDIHRAFECVATFAQLADQTRAQPQLIQHLRRLGRFQRGMQGAFIDALLNHGADARHDGFSAFI